MSRTFVFGYGSLVNALTHSHAPLYPAQLDGWRRIWGMRFPDRGLTSLSITEEAGALTEGVIAEVAPEAWSTLDTREAGYQRLALPPGQITHDGPPDAQIITYAAPQSDPANSDYPILASYLDVVMQGFFALGGQPAQERFVATTAGWGDSLADDRAAPLYPRPTPMTDEERRSIDALLPSGLKRVPAPKR